MHLICVYSECLFHLSQRARRQTIHGLPEKAAHDCCSPKSDDLWANSWPPLLSMSLCRVLMVSRPWGVLPLAAATDPLSKLLSPCFKTSVLWVSLRDDPGDPLGCSLFFLQEMTRFMRWPHGNCLDPLLNSVTKPSALCKGCRRACLSILLDSPAKVWGKHLFQMTRVETPIAARIRPAAAPTAPTVMPTGKW